MDGPRFAYPFTHCGHSGAIHGLTTVNHAAVTTATGSLLSALVGTDPEVDLLGYWGLISRGTAILFALSGCTVLPSRQQRTGF